MRYGFVIPLGDVHTIPELAAEAEAAGWDGVFIPDCIGIDTPDVKPGPGYDPWIVLAAVALRTQRVRLGTMLTALPRRRPWKLARECVTLDELSGGRLTLAVGIGAAEDDAGFYRVGEAMDRTVRAQMMDEGLRILTGLWSGEPFTFAGEHYRIEGLTLLPRPVQRPRIPIWVVGVWPGTKSLRRALRYDGVVPQKAAAPGGAGGAMTTADLAALRAYIDERHSDEQRGDAGPFDLIAEGTTPGADRERAIAHVRPYSAAGVTWWIEAMWSAPEIESVRQRIRQGPPRETTPPAAARTKN